MSIESSSIGPFRIEMPVAEDFDLEAESSIASSSAFEILEAETSQNHQHRLAT